MERFSRKEYTGLLHPYNLKNYCYIIPVISAENALKLVQSCGSVQVQRNFFWWARALGPILAVRGAAFYILQGGEMIHCFVVRTVFPFQKTDKTFRKQREILKSPQKKQAGLFSSPPVKSIATIKSEWILLLFGKIFKRCFLQLQFYGSRGVNGCGALLTTKKGVASNERRFFFWYFFIVYKTVANKVDLMNSQE